MTKDLRSLVNQSNKITIAAIDHRGSLKQELHPENPESTTHEEMMAWKRRMIALYKDVASGILIDPIFGRELLNPTMVCGWMLSMEKTGYRGDQQARETEILPDWSVAQAKAMGGSGVKLLLYYDPENVELAKKQRAIACAIAYDCQREGVIFLLEPLSYGIEESQKAKVVLATVAQLKDLAIDILKIEYPGDRVSCEAVSAMVTMPWVLLSAGMEYSKYKDALQVACESGAGGMAVGRAVWQEFGQYQGQEREDYFTSVALPRMQELVGIVNAYGKSV